MGIAQLGEEVGQGLHIELKLALQGAIGQAAPLTQQGQRLIDDRDKVHPVSFLLSVSLRTPGRAHHPTRNRESAEGSGDRYLCFCRRPRRSRRGQDFLDKIGQLVIVGDEAEAEPVEASIGEFLDLARDCIGITDRQQPAIARAIARRRCSASHASLPADWRD